MSDQEFVSLGLRDRLSPYGLTSPAAMLSHWVAGRDRLAASVAGEPTSRWDKQILDVSTFKAFGAEWASAVRNDVQMFVELESHAPPEKGPSLPPSERGRLEAARFMRRAWVALLDGDKPRALALSSQAVESCPTDAEAGGMLDGLRAEQSSPANPR
jgi:hypothetical protein